MDKVLSGLRREIYSGIRLPRERLVENDIAGAFKVNRMVVRQALAQLQNDGLVVIEPYKGAAVAEISLSRMLENYQVVAMLEGYAAYLAVDHLDDDDIKNLEHNLERQQALDINDIQKWQQVNLQFHRIINLKCRNERLVELIRQNIQFTTYWFIVLSSPGRIRTNIQQHQEILQALKDRDRDKARSLTEEHLVSAGRYLVDFMKKNVPVGMWRQGG